MESAYPNFEDSIFWKDVASGQFPGSRLLLSSEVTKPLSKVPPTA